MIWSGSGMLVRVCVVLGGRGQNGTMTVVGSWWRRRELRGGRRGRVVAHRTVYRQESRLEWVLLISVV